MPTWVSTTLVMFEYLYIVCWVCTTAFKKLWAVFSFSNCRNYLKGALTTTSTERVFEIFPRYLPQFSGFALRPTCTRPVFHEEFPGAFGFHISSLTAELFTSSCLLQSSSCFSGNIFLSLGQRFRFGLVSLHRLGGESLVSCVSHGTMGGLL